jgi:arabinose-5-phosphate isomerase
MRVLIKELFPNCLKNLNLLTFSETPKISNSYEKIILTLDNEGDLWNLMPVNSSTIYLMILQYIAIKIAKIKNIPKSVFLKNHPGGSIGKK